MDYGGYDGYDDERPRWRIPAAVGVAIAIAVIGLFGVSQLRSGSGEGGVTPDSTSASTTARSTPPTRSTEVTGDDTSSIAGSEDETPPDETTPDETTPDETSPADTTVVESEPATTLSSVAAPTTVQEQSTAGYPTNPDGSPLPLVVIYDVDTITVSGQVPSQESKDRLAALAVANSQFPDAALIDNMVINPAVPISVGVRVIELNSARFPEGTATILPDHAAELDRVVNVMQALPNISVLVVGHADQRGDELKNFALSDERARSVVNYLLYLGVSQTRLSSRAAGASDLLTLGDDDAALALNRRTEFIFSGLLVE